VNDLEDRLKQAYTAATDTVTAQSIRRLDEQSVVITWPAAKAPRPARRWAIPLTGAAVIAVAVAAALPTFLNSAGGGNVPLSPLGERFISAFTANSRHFYILKASTGLRVAAVAVPGSQSIFEAAATGNGVTYVAAVGRPGSCDTRLYRFRLNSAGKPSQLTSFDGGFLRSRVQQLALSADGRTFAYLARRCGATRPGLNVVNFASGQHRQWSVPGDTGLSPMSMSGDGNLLTFASGSIKDSGTAIFLLKTTSAPGPIFQRSRVLVRANRFGDYSLSQPQISLNGRVVYFTSSANSISNAATQVRSVETSTRRLRLIVRGYGAFFTISADPSVRRAIVISFADLVGRTALKVNLSTGKLTRLKPSFYVPNSGGYLW